MDHGRLFSTPNPTLGQVNAVRGGSFGEVSSKANIADLSKHPTAVEFRVHGFAGSPVIIGKNQKGTVSAPILEPARVADAVADAFPEAIVEKWDVVPLDEPSGYYVAYEGRYLTPNFQSGEKPYEVEGGAILFDGDGAPILNELEDIRFAVTVPKSAEMPAAGWPLVLYGHGTGGDYRSFIRASGNAPARILAQRGFAVLSIDQPLHGERGTGSDSVFLSFNFSNPDSGEGSARVVVTCLREFV